MSILQMPASDKFTFRLVNRRKYTKKDKSTRGKQIFLIFDSQSSYIILLSYFLLSINFTFENSSSSLLDNFQISNISNSLSHSTILSNSPLLYIYIVINYNIYRRAVPIPTVFQISFLVQSEFQ